MKSRPCMNSSGRQVERILLAVRTHETMKQCTCTYARCSVRVPDIPEVAHSDTLALEIPYTKFTLY